MSATPAARRSGDGPQARQGVITTVCQESPPDAVCDPGSGVKRRTVLVRAGLVGKSGRTRPTQYGRQAIEWIAT